MNKNEKRLHEALAKIAEVASVAVNGGSPSPNGHDHKPGEDGHDHAHDVGCTLRSLPERLLVEAAATAADINPVNAPVFGPMAHLAMDVMDPLKIAVLTSKYWGSGPRQLTVSFVESTPADLRAKIIRHMNAWTKTACISFVETQGTGVVRISRSPDGYWSYLGTDVLHIPSNRQTMNLEGFTMNTPESEFVRVVRHETGHTLGFPHEHMRRELVAKIDRQKAYDYFWRTQGWNPRIVDQQVLTPLDDRSIMATPADQDSIMCYQLPGSITRDGRSIRGGLDINQTDYGFAGRIYPKPTRDLRQDLDVEQHDFAPHQHTGIDWDPGEDVREPQAALLQA